MSQNEQTAAELLEHSIHQPGRHKKKDFVESLRHKRLIHLDRAAMCEELLAELGSPVDEFETTEDLDMPQPERPNRRRHRETSGGSGQDMSAEGRAQSEEGRPVTKEGEPDLRFQQNFDVRAKEAGQTPRDTETPVTKEGKPDKRYKPNETEAQYKARHMMEVPEGQTDGRGEVTDPENDLRLKQNLGKRAEIAAQKSE